MSIRVLLHCCCGPCALYPLKALRERGHEISGFFYNPNIHPYQEYIKRRAAFVEMARREALPTVNQVSEANLEYGLDVFMGSISGIGVGAYEPVSKERCRICYRIRLEKTAELCDELAYDAFSTSLLVSPYQDHEMIKDIGGEIAAGRGLKFLYEDFRPGYYQGRSMAREAGLYAQAYCGCVFSEWERYEAKKR